MGALAAAPLGSVRIVPNQMSLILGEDLMFLLVIDGGISYEQ